MARSIVISGFVVGLALCVGVIYFAFVANSRTHSIADPSFLTTETIELEMSRFGRARGNVSETARANQERAIRQSVLLRQVVRSLSARGWREGRVRQLTSAESLALIEAVNDSLTLSEDDRISVNRKRDGLFELIIAQEGGQANFDGIVP